MTASPQASDAEIDKNLLKMTRGYVATSDCPAALFTEDFLRIYPDAIVIYSTRDKVSWWKSMQGTTATVCPWWIFPLVIPVPVLRCFLKYAMAFEPRHVAYR